MALWCRDVQMVDIPAGMTPKPVTFVYPYYENAEFLQCQIAHWWTYPEALRQFLSIMIVDDGSPEPARLPDLRPCAMRLFRIDVDIRWNWLAARNIGAHHANEGWLLLTDMDHLVPTGTLHSLIAGAHDPSVCYAFRRREHTGAQIHPHSASFFMTRKTFWRIGGYDETFSGWYGTDGLYRRRLAMKAPLQLLRDELWRYEHVGDSSTRRYGRKEVQDVQARVLAKQLGPTHQPKTLTFPYKEVTA